MGKVTYLDLIASCYLRGMTVIATSSSYFSSLSKSLSFLAKYYLKAYLKNQPKICFFNFSLFSQFAIDYLASFLRFLQPTYLDHPAPYSTNHFLKKISFLDFFFNFILLSLLKLSFLVILEYDHLPHLLRPIHYFYWNLTMKFPLSLALIDYPRALHQGKPLLSPSFYYLYLSPLLNFLMTSVGTTY